MPRGTLPERGDLVRYGRVTVERRYNGRGRYAWVWRAAWLVGDEVVHEDWRECKRLALARKPEGFDGRVRAWKREIKKVRPRT